MTALATDWLAGIANEERRLEYIREPHSIDWRGETWSFASDGRVIVAIKGASNFTEISSVNSRGAVESVLNRVVNATGDAKAKVSALQEWCCGCELYGKCEACEGTGQVYCPHCDREGAVCDECGGDGKEWLTHEGWLCGVGLNKSLLRRVVEHLPPREIVTIGSDSLGDMAALVGESFVAGVMGLRIEKGPDDDVFEAFIEARKSE